MKRSRQILVEHSATKYAGQNLKLAILTMTKYQNSSVMTWLKNLSDKLQSSEASINTFIAFLTLIGIYTYAIAFNDERVQNLSVHLGAFVGALIRGFWPWIHTDVESPNDGVKDMLWTIFFSILFSLIASVIAVVVFFVIFAFIEPIIPTESFHIFKELGSAFLLISAYLASFIRGRIGKNS